MDAAFLSTDVCDRLRIVEDEVTEEEWFALNHEITLKGCSRCEACFLRFHNDEVIVAEIFHLTNTFRVPEQGDGVVDGEIFLHIDVSGEDRVAGIRVIIVLILAEMLETVVSNETSQCVECPLSRDAISSHISPDTFER